MKNILIIIALFAFLNSYATDPLSWGKKGGSGGVTQSQLDAKVDTSLIKTGQEAIDSLAANIARTPYGGEDITIISNILGGTLKLAPMFGYDWESNSQLTLSDSRLRGSLYAVTTKITINTIQAQITDLWVGTPDAENGIAAYKLNATRDTAFFQWEYLAADMWTQALNNGTYIKYSIGSDITMGIGAWYLCTLSNFSATTNVGDIRYSIANNNSDTQFAINSDLPMGFLIDGISEFPAYILVSDMTDNYGQLNIQLHYEE